MTFFGGLIFIDWVEQVNEVKGDDVVCVIKNTATLTGSLFTLHASQIRIDLPTLSTKDKEVSRRPYISVHRCYIFFEEMNKQTYKIRAVFLLCKILFGCLNL